MLMLCCWCLLAAMACIAAAGPAMEGVPWTYAEQQLWPLRWPACGGPRQSPTRLDAQLLQLGSRPRLSFAQRLHAGRVHATNTGHTLQLRLEAGGAGRTAPLVTLSAEGAPLSGTYRLEQLHFHWGNASGRAGSEHQLGSRLADAEAHFVFFGSQFANGSAAARQSDGLAVLAVLLEGRGAAGPDTLRWPPLGLQGRLAALAAVGSRLTVAADLRPLAALLRRAVRSVLAYGGSLTTPPCSPVVRWLVALRPAVVPRELLRELSSSLYAAGPGRQLLHNNRRWLQARHHRLVVQHVSFD
ncbi:carbonic anhydrase 12-like [Amphibalanus amphitrite]|uniref:carbonic anhydrase 12-like n=1 Tax=Amphibalanus amphitrite TaxID=1232801 RepID=UPI001C90E59F|nr:carbonic anhydrase 12-like [Amphibalanus amphitrite]